MRRAQSLASPDRLCVKWTRPSPFPLFVSLRRLLVASFLLVQRKFHSERQKKRGLEEFNRVLDGIIKV
jgi:hypothetical protein